MVPVRTSYLLVLLTLPVFVFLLVAGRAVAQTPATSGAVMRTGDRALVQEKLFVHTDKTFYLAGEICWFKIYDVEAALHRPVDISKVAYVEILDKDNKFVLQGKVALQEAEGAGSFFLPLTLATGNYRLRAYTNWMKNFGPDYFFEEPISIVNTLKSIPLPATVNDYHIAFFPEGGNLVKGISTRIAFQVTDQRGRGVSCKGVVLNANNDTLASFQPLRFGIGHFFFTPPDNGTCKATVQMPNGEMLTADLPPAYDKGLVMNLGEKKDDPSKIIVRVHARGGGSPDVYLVANMGQPTQRTWRGGLINDSVIFTIDKTVFGEGVSRITLFDGNMRPACERLYCQRPTHSLLVDAVTDLSEYGPRSKVNLQIRTAVQGSSGGAASLPASLSLSVFRLDSLQSPQGMDIHNYLWLTSDLKGNVESPETYLSSRGEEADQALDNLMMVHGWTRFEPVFSYPPEYVGQLITARLTDIKTGEPLKERVGFFSVPGTDFIFQSAATDSTGRVTFDIKNFYGPGGFILHSGEEADSPCKVEVVSPFSEQYSDRPLVPFSSSAPLRPDDYKQWLTDHSVGMQVQNVYSGDSLLRFRAPAQDSLRFFGRPDHAYLLDDYTRFTTMEEVLREYVREINVNHWHGRLHAVLLNEPMRLFFDDNDDLVLLDGVPVPKDRIFSYDPLKVKRLEVVPHQYFLGPSVFNGIASFTTYKGDYEGFELDPHSLLIDYEGIQLQREFYSPVYATGQQVADRQPDFRNLLFWSPEIHTDVQGKRECSFYTSDLPGKYVAVVQGIAHSGEAGAKYIYFEVKTP